MRPQREWLCFWHAGGTLPVTHWAPDQTARVRQWSLTAEGLRVCASVSASGGAGVGILTLYELHNSKRVELFQSHLGNITVAISLLRVQLLRTVQERSCILHYWPGSMLYTFSYGTVCWSTCSFFCVFYFLILLSLILLYYFMILPWEVPRVCSSFLCQKHCVEINYYMWTATVSYNKRWAISRWVLLERF